MDPQARQRRGVGVLYREPGRAAGRRATGRALPHDADPEPDATAHGRAHDATNTRPGIGGAVAAGVGGAVAGGVAIAGTHRVALGR